MELFKILAPAVITILANVIILLFLKNRVDRRIEQFKVVHSGIFKERLEIYRLLLRKTVKIKAQIYRYGYGTGEPKKIMGDINRLIDLLRINRPFISPEINRISSNLIWLFQEILDAFYLGNKNLTSNSDFNPDHNKAYIAALNELKKNEEFKKLEDMLDGEIRKSLGFDKIEKIDSKKTSNFSSQLLKLLPLS